MADLGIRTLERRFQASRSPEDELAWLRERVRLGQRLEWAAYTRLAELSAQEAAAYLSRLVELGPVESERLSMAACCGHVPARIAQRWVTTTAEPGFGQEMVRCWVRLHETAALSFELVRAAVVHVLECATASGVWTAAEGRIALEALEDCSAESSWSPQAEERLELRLRASRDLGPLRSLMRRSVMRLGSRYQLGSRAFPLALEAAEELAQALGTPLPWADMAARVLVEPRPQPPPPPREVRTPDGFARFTSLPSRDLAFHRLRATKPLLPSPQERQLELETSQVDRGEFFAAVHALFGRPHDMHDDWTGSISYYLDVDVDPARHGRFDLSPVKLLLGVVEQSRSLELRLRMQRRADPDEGEAPGVGDDVLPPDLRVAVRRALLGYVQDYASRTRLPDFERAYPGFEVKRPRYGVRDGVPFDEARLRNKPT